MGSISLIRVKGHSFAVISIVKALRLNLRDSLLFLLMFCLTDSSDSFLQCEPDAVTHRQLHPLVTFTPNYEMFDKRGCFTKGLVD